MGKVLDKTEQKNASFFKICKIPDFSKKSLPSKAEKHPIFQVTL